MLQYLLVERGLDPTVNDNHLLLIACINNNEKMVRMLYAMPGVRLPLGKIQVQLEITEWRNYECVRCLYR